MHMDKSYPLLYSVSSACIVHDTCLTCLKCFVTVLMYSQPVLLNGTIIVIRSLTSKSFGGSMNFNFFYCLSLTYA
jgi:hypothetical protein